MNVVNDFHNLFLEQRPLIDLRAPIEFEKGAFSQAVNLPLMTNEERTQVGICYKQQGQQAAIVLGNQLVSGQVRQQRLTRWLNFCQQHQQGVIYCFRGGLRSQTVQQWLLENGINYPLVQGGYKALRNFLLTQIEHIAQHPLLLVAGNTGSGKTELLTQCAHSLDLEGAAHHRGSSFGAFVTPPATQINFEDKLAEQYISRQYRSFEQNIVLEDEGRLIGHVHLPLSLEKAMQMAKVVVLVRSFEYRLERLLNEYVIEMASKFILKYGSEQGAVAFREYLQQGLFRVRKRLGSQRYISLEQAMNAAFLSQKEDDMRVHLNWLAPLLQHYYDPMYQYQLLQKKQRIVFQGSEKDCLAFFNQK